MAIVFQLVIILLVIVIGALLTTYIGKTKKPEVIGLSILLGSVVFSYIYFLCHYFLDIQFTFSSLFYLLTILTLLLSIPLSVVFSNLDKATLLQRLNQQLKFTLPQSKIQKFLVTILAISVLITLFNNLFWPITDWDAIALYDFRAKVLTQTGNFDDGIRRGYFLQYPPYTSILHTVSYLVGFDQAKIWYSLLYFSYLLLFFSLLKNEQNQTVSLLGTVVLAVSPLIISHAQMAYTNLPYTIFISLGYLYLFQWIRKGDKSDLLAGSMLSAASTWVRLSEPFWFFSVLLIIVGTIMHKKQALYSLLGGITIYLLKLPWLRFVAKKEMTTSEPTVQLLPSGGSGLFSLEVVKNIPEVTVFLFNSVWPVLRLYSIPFILTIIFLWKKKSINKLSESLIFIVPLGMVYVGTLLFSISFPEWKSIPDSAARMSMFLVPLMIFYVFNSGVLSFIEKEQT